MILVRLLCAITVCLGLTVTTRAMSGQPSPIYVSYETGAYAAAPVIYTLTINGRVLYSPKVAYSGAAEVPPVGSGGISTSVQRLPPPNDTILDIKVEWTEIWSGRQYAIENQLDEDLFPWFKGEGLNLNITFEQNGGFAIRVISQERWEDAMAMTSSGLPTLADYPIAFETCAPLLDRPSLGEAEVGQMLSEIWAVDMDWIQASRDRPLPAARCVGLKE